VNRAKKGRKIIRGHREEGRKRKLNEVRIGSSLSACGEEKDWSGAVFDSGLTEYLAATVLCCLGGEKEGRKEGR